MPKTPRPRIDIEKAADLFADTTGAAGHEQAEEKDTVKTLSIGLHLSEIATLDQYAAELGVTRHGLMTYAIRKFMRDYQDGKRPETSTKTVLKV